MVALSEKYVPVDVFGDSAAALRQPGGREALLLAERSGAKSGHLPRLPEAQTYAGQEKLRKERKERDDLERFLMAWFDAQYRKLFLETYNILQDLRVKTAIAIANIQSEIVTQEKKLEKEPEAARKVNELKSRKERLEVLQKEQIEPMAKKLRVDRSDQAPSRDELNELRHQSERMRERFHEDFEEDIRPSNPLGLANRFNPPANSNTPPPPSVERGLDRGDFGAFATATTTVTGTTGKKKKKKKIGEANKNKHRLRGDVQPEDDGGDAPEPAI